MTPSQLKAFAAIVRHGSAKLAAEELGVSEAAISSHTAALRKELNDPLYRRSANGLAFTPGGLRLATRAAELLGLQDQTRLEVEAASRGQRILRLATTALFAEYAAPGLIELFKTRADDLHVEMSVHQSGNFTDLLASRQADVTIGPSAPNPQPDLTTKEFLRISTDPRRFGETSARSRPSDEAATGEPTVAARPRGGRGEWGDLSTLETLWGSGREPAHLSKSRGSACGDGGRQRCWGCPRVSSPRGDQRRKAASSFGRWGRGVRNLGGHNPWTDKRTPGCSRASSVHHNPSSHPGNADRIRRKHRPLPTPRSRDPLELKLRPCTAHRTVT